MTPAEKLLFLKKEYNRDGAEVIGAFHDTRRDHVGVRAAYKDTATFLGYRYRARPSDAHIELVFNAFLTRRLAG